MNRSVGICSPIALKLAACVSLSCLFSGLAQTNSPTASLETNSAFLVDLPAVLRLAGAQNLDVQIARARLDEARAVRQSAVLQFFPWLAPGVAYGKHDGNIQAVDGTILDVNKQVYTAGGALVGQLVLGDAIYNSLAARQLVKAADQGLEAQRQESAASAAQAYFDLARTQAATQVTEEGRRISRDYQNQLHEAVAAGIAFKGDELRVQTQTERYEIAVRQGQEQQRIASANLALILHLDAAVELTAQEADLAPLTLVEGDTPLSALVQRALTARPETKQSQALVAAADANRNGAVYGPLVPNLNGLASVGGLGGGKNGNTGDFGQSEDYYVGLNWKIGPGGLFDFGRIRATRARLETARLSGEKLKDQIARQVVEAVTRVRSLSDQMRLTQRNLTTAQETLRLARERKEYGVGIVLEDIQAQQDLTRARLDYLNAIADFNKAQYALTRAMGGLGESSNK